MDRITHYEIGEPVLEYEDLDQVPGHDQNANEGENRRYSAEAVFDVLDPYAAIIDGIPAPAPKS